jgi:SAM-dependent methyltransferase
VGTGYGDEERQRLAASFDQASRLYHQARPDYPQAIYDRLLTVTGLGPGDRALEIGAATGKATLPLARQGLLLTCLEPGPALAAEARTNLTGSGALVIESRFEDWRPGAERFDFVFAATAWHWLEPSVKYAKAADVLRPGGHLAYWSATHVVPLGGDPFFEEIQAVYDEIGEAVPPGTTFPRPGELPEAGQEMMDSRRFRVVEVSQFDWETVHDAEGYINLLSTFSGHLVMEPWKRDRLYGEVRRRLALRQDGLLRRHWGAVLHVGQRLDRGGDGCAG